MFKSYLGNRYSKQSRQKYVGMWVEKLLSVGIIPEPVLRWYIRRRLTARIEKDPTGNAREEYYRRLREQLTNSPIAINVRKANEQHYELPAEFFEIILGSRLKYSACLWEGEHNDLDRAEIDMLNLTIERVGISTGMRVLDLGCGWGSFCLYLAEKYPEVQITALSNSKIQRKFIQHRQMLRGLDNLRVVTSDINEFESRHCFDRIVSIEMFEHMRNYEKLLSKISQMLEPRGKVFVHIFARRGVTYLFHEDNRDDFMARYFFAGGTMPNEYLIPSMSHGLHLDHEWTVNGKHYSRTLEIWLKRMKGRRRLIWPLLEHTYGKQHAKKWWEYWKIFFISCAELFGYEDGEEWFVKHYLFSKS